MNLYCLGVNHRTAPIAVREKLWFSADEAGSFLTTLRGQFVEECALVSTCNRTELYYVTGPSFRSGLPLWEMLARFKRAEENAHEENFYTLASLHAVHHLYKLSSGIDSMVLGDVQILNQVKSAFAIAQESACAGPLLHRVFSGALHVGKRARTETEIGEGAVSVGYASAELASKIFGDLAVRSALLIGAGETGELTAKHLSSNRLGTLFIANRTRERAEDLSRRLGATAVDYESHRSLLPDVDIVITSVMADGHILTAADLRQAMKKRNNKPLVVIDLGVPRNVDPLSGAVANLFLHDIDGLQNIVTQNLSRRGKEIPKVQHIILDELKQFEQWLSARELVPTIQELQRRFEEIRRLEVDRVHTRFSPDVNEEITMITKRIVNKILHTPMVNLRNAAKEGMERNNWRDLQVLRSVFGLGHHVQDDMETATIDLP